MSLCGGVKNTETQTLKRCSNIWFLPFLCELSEAVCGEVFAKADSLEVVSKLLLQVLENCHVTLHKSLGLALPLSLCRGEGIRSTSLRHESIRQRHIA